MTVIVALTPKDGVVLYSDTQESEISEDGTTLKRNYQLKLHVIRKDRFAIGCAGISDDIKEFRDYLILRLEEQEIDRLTPTQFGRKLDREILTKFLEDVRADRKRKFRKKVPLEFDCEGLLAARFYDNEFKIYRITIEINDKKKLYIAKARDVSQLYFCIGHDHLKVDVFLGTIENLLNKYDTHFGKLSLELCGMICQLVLGLSFKKAIWSGGTIHALKLTKDGVEKLDQKCYWDMKKDVIAQTILQAIREIKLPKDKLVKFVATLLSLDEKTAAQLVDSWLQAE